MTQPTVAVVCGGLGGARLALALQAAGLEADSTFVTNVGDDWWVGGLRVCPDTDAVLYALAGRFDEERGWGVRGDVFPGPRPGEPEWFGLGEQDREHHRARTRLLESGHDLARATQELATGLGVRAQVIPATGDPVGTVIETPAGRLRFQEWMVRERGAPTVLAVEWPGLESARPSVGVLEALRESSVVVIASSSPVASVEPVLGIPGVREALQDRAGRGPMVALAPVVAGTPPASPRDRHRAAARAGLLASRGLAHDPVAAMSGYRELLTHIVLDPADRSIAAAMRDPRVLLAPVLDQSVDARRRLVEAILSTLEKG